MAPDIPTKASSPGTLRANPDRSAALLRCVVIGGSGQIGGWLLRELAGRGHSAVGTFATVSFTGLVQLDASDLGAAAAWVTAQAPDVVFYPAGFTWVDCCERDRTRAYSANLEQPLNLARAAALVGARFVYFSTDYVFDGHGGPYTEDSPTHPLSVYGQAKRDAELALADELGDRQLTVRTSWVFGPERQGKNFAYQLLRNLAEGKPTVCPSDQVSSPGYGPDVARAVVRLVEQDVSGMIHVVGPEVIDRVAFARAIARAFGHDTSLITGKPTAKLGQGAPRPLSGGLLTRRLDPIHPGLMRPLAAALDDFRARLLDPELSQTIKPVPGFPADGARAADSSQPAGE
jgi:dTDP-4-dehydrorhamnose reductase